MCSKLDSIAPILKGGAPKKFSRPPAGFVFPSNTISYRVTGRHSPFATPNSRRAASAPREGAGVRQLYPLLEIQVAPTQKHSVCFAHHEVRQIGVEIN
jgi:hypothetical protein